MHQCNSNACINGTSQNFGLESFSHHQTHDKNVLISGIYTHLRNLRNETSGDILWESLRYWLVKRWQ